MAERFQDLEQQLSACLHEATEISEPRIEATLNDPHTRELGGWDAIVFGGLNSVTEYLWNAFGLVTHLEFPPSKVWDVAVRVATVSFPDWQGGKQDKCVRLRMTISSQQTYYGAHEKMHELMAFRSGGMVYATGYSKNINMLNNWFDGEFRPREHTMPDGLKDCLSYVPWMERQSLNFFRTSCRGETL